MDLGISTSIVESKDRGYGNGGLNHELPSLQRPDDRRGEKRPAELNPDLVSMYDLQQTASRLRGQASLRRRIGPAPDVQIPG